MHTTTHNSSARSTTGQRPISTICASVLNLLIFSAALMCVLALAGCSKKNPAESNPPNGSVLDLTLTPSHAAPGAPVQITGIQLDVSDLSSYAVFFGDVQSFLASDEFGNASAVAPFFPDTALVWHSPPVGKLDVSIFRSDILIATANAAFTSDSLPQAFGSTQSVVTSLNSLAQSFKDILGAFPLEPGIQQQIFFALSEAIDSFSVSEDLQGIMDSLASSPEALELADAVIASAGFDQTVASLSDAFAVLAQAVSNTGTATASAEPLLNDTRLATMMQMAGVLDEYASSFVKGTSGGLSDLGTVFAALGMFSNKFEEFLKKLPNFKDMMTALQIGYTIADLLYTKLIVAALPTQLDSLKLVIPKQEIKVLDTTASTKFVFASNKPPAVSADDLIGLFFDFAGLVVDAKGNNTTREEAQKKVLALLGFLKKALKEYKDSNPDFGYDPDVVDLFSIPEIKWVAEITDASLVDLFVGSEGLTVKPLQEILEWRGSAPGVADVWFESKPAEVSVNGLFFGFPVPIPFVFQTTTFGVMEGAEVPFSRRIPIGVGGQLFLILQFPSTIKRDSIGILQVTTGYLDGTGNFPGIQIPEPDLIVDLSVVGGIASPSSGVTDENGNFFSDISLSSNSDTVIVEIVVTDDEGLQISDTVLATVESVQDTVSRIAFMSRRDGTKGLWVMPPSDTSAATRLTSVTASDEHFDLRWSSNFENVAYYSNGSAGADLWVAGMDGSLMQVSGTHGVSDHLEGAQFSPVNPSTLLFAASFGSLSSALFTYSVPSQSYGMFSPTGQTYRCPRFSPSGQHISYFRGRSTPITWTIVFLTVDGSSGTRKHQGISHDQSSRLRELTWSADGDFILYIRSGDGAPDSIFRLDAFGDGANLLHTAPMIGSLHSVPGTREIIYWEASGTAIDGIFVQDIDNGSRAIIPNTVGLTVKIVDISPDGRSIVYDRYQGALVDLFRADIATGVHTQITADGSSSMPTWSPW